MISRIKRVSRLPSLNCWSYNHRSVLATLIGARGPSLVEDFHLLLQPREGAMENGRSRTAIDPGCAAFPTPPRSPRPVGCNLSSIVRPPPPPTHPRRRTGGVGGGPRWPLDSPGKKVARCPTPLRSRPWHPAQQFGIIPTHQPRGSLPAINRKFFHPPPLRSQPRSQAHRQRHRHRQHYARSMPGFARPRASV
jgi:hypothetical protein